MTRGDRITARAASAVASEETLVPRPRIVGGASPAPRKRAREWRAASRPDQEPGHR